MEQFAPAARVAPQLFTKTNEDGSAPPMTMLVIVKVALPVLVRVTDCDALAVPSVIAPKERPVDDKLTPGAYTFKVVLACTARFNGGLRPGFRLRDAVSLSPFVALDMTRLLNVAEPEERLAEVVPPKSEALSDIVTGMVGTVATTPLSFNPPTGAGESACPGVPLAGGWVVKDSA